MPLAVKSVYAARICLEECSGDKLDPRSSEEVITVAEDVSLVFIFSFEPGDNGLAQSSLILLTHLQRPENPSMQFFGNGFGR